MRSSSLLPSSPSSDTPPDIRMSLGVSSSIPAPVLGHPFRRVGRLRPAVRVGQLLLELADLAAGDLVRAVRGADKAAVVDARVFDVFAGQGVPEGKKSVAVEIVLQPGDKSFTDAEIKAIADKVVAAAAKQGAELRG